MPSVPAGLPRCSSGHPAGSEQRPHGDVAGQVQSRERDHQCQQVRIELVTQTRGTPNEPCRQVMPARRQLAPHHDGEAVRRSPATATVAGTASDASMSSNVRPLVSKPNSQNATAARPYQNAT